MTNHDQAVAAALSEAIELLRQTQRLLRTTWASKGDFAYEANLHVLSVENFLAESVTLNPIRTEP